eukprot:8947667-Heterocapsa_arctica.AAC.1
MEPKSDSTSSRKPICTGKTFSNMMMKLRSSSVSYKKLRTEHNGVVEIKWLCLRRWKTSKLKFPVMECLVRSMVSKAMMKSTQT